MAMNQSDCISSCLKGKNEEVKLLLSSLIGFESTYGNEKEVQDYLFGYCMEKDIQISRHIISDDLKSDPCYSNSQNDVSFEGRYNLFGKIKGSGGGRSVIINAHTDVVPAPGSWEKAFAGEIHGDTVKGRGACDDKGGIVSILMAIDAVNHSKMKLSGDVEYQFVIDEEVGGNGTLSLIEGGHQADCAVVVEPTGLDMYIAGRGCVWFKITVPGKSVHMAEINQGISAIEHSIEIMNLLKSFEKEFVRKHGSHELFKWHERPSQLNVGMICGGEIPSMVPEKVIIEGGLGFLPNTNLKSVTEELKEFLYDNIHDEWLKARLKIEFNRLRNESFEEDAKCECIESMRGVLAMHGLDHQPKGFIASCDARLFHHHAKMPCMTFGPGNVRHAHSTEEECSAEEILTAAQVIADFIVAWCG
jgi:acetylornithine deacetylase